MGRVNETVRTVNSAARTIIFGVAVAGAGLVGWKGYSIYNEPQEQLAEKQRELDEVAGKLKQAEDDLTASREEVISLSADLADSQAENDRLQTSLRLIKLRRRIARLRVLDQRRDPNANQVITKIAFYEVNEDGAPIDASEPKQFEVVGDLVYVDCLVVKFEDRYVEMNDLDRNMAICLFQRIYGEFQQPHEGYAIDKVGASPTSYARDGEMSPFEQKVWADFWTLANDPGRAGNLGIRAAHGDAPSIRVRAGSTYELTLSSTGEFSFKRVQEPAGPVY